MSFNSNGVNLKGQFNLKNTDPIDGRYVITSADEYSSLITADNGVPRYLYPGLTFTVTNDLTLSGSTKVKKGTYRVASDGKTVTPCYGNLVAGTNIDFDYGDNDSVTINVGTDYSDGEDGVGIAKAEVEYATGTATEPTNTSWSATAPTWAEGIYIWQRVKFTYTDGKIEYSDPWCAQGATGAPGKDGTNGTNGRSVKSVEEWYLLSKSSSDVTKDSTGTNAEGTATNVQWSKTLTNPTKAAPYLWNYEVIKDDKGAVINETAPVILLKYTEDGEDGRGIKEIVNWYLTTSAASGVTISTAGWKKSPDVTTSEKKYLWNYEEIEWTKADSSGKTKTNTTPVIIGVHGQDGTGIEIKGSAFAPIGYSIQTNTTTFLYSDSSRAQQIMNPKDGDSYLVDGYLFVYTGTNDNKFLCSGQIQGPQGNSGRGISNCIEYYMASSRATGVKAGEDGETTDEQWIAAGGDVALPTISASKPYLWNYEHLVYTDGTDSTFDATIIGTYGKNGRGIREITEYYARHTSNTTAPTSGWVKAETGWTMPEVNSTYKYLWNKEIRTWSDGTIEEEPPVMIGAYGDTGATPSISATSVEQFIYWNTTKTAPGSSDMNKIYTLQDRHGNTLKDSENKTSCITVEDTSTIDDILFTDASTSWQAVGSNNKPNLDRYQPIFRRNKITVSGKTVYTVPELMNKECTGLGVFCRIKGESVIDGGTITTGSITADKISINDLSALNADIGSWKINEKALYSTSDGLSSGLIAEGAEASKISYDSLEFKLIEDGAAYEVSGFKVNQVDAEALYIPAEYEGLPVKSIGFSALQYSTNLKKVVIAYGITNIDFNAFTSGQFERIAIPDSVTNISFYAFQYCQNLKAVVLPRQLKLIEEGVFYNCTSLESVVIPDSVTSIGEFAFGDCPSLKNIYYLGDESHWKQITIGANNDVLKNATVHYNSQGNVLDVAFLGLPSLIATNETDGTQQLSPVRFFAGQNKGDALLPHIASATTPTYVVLEDGSFYANAAKITGTVHAIDGYFKGEVQAQRGKLGGLYIQEDSIFAEPGENEDENPIVFNKNGYVQAKNLEIIETLKIKKLAGRLGGNTYLEFDELSSSTDSISITAETGVIEEGSSGFLGLGVKKGSVKVTLKANMSLTSSKNITIKVYYNSNGKSNGKYEVTRTQTVQIEKNHSWCSLTVDHMIEYIDYDWANNPVSRTGKFYKVEVVNKSFTQPSNLFNSAIVSGSSIVPKGSTQQVGETTVATTCGSSRAPWGEVHGCKIYAVEGYFLNGAAFTSDVNKKNTIASIDEKYSILFDKLHPVTYKLNEDTDNSVHIGLIAQELKESMDSCGIASQDLAAYCTWQESNGNETCGIRYTEFIALCINEIQKLKKENSALKESNEALETRLTAIEQKLGISE